MKLKTLYALWDELADVPIFQNDTIAKEFLHFPICTFREEIWHWFEAQNPRFIVGEVQQGIHYDD